MSPIPGAVDRSKESSGSVNLEEAPSEDAGSNMTNERPLSIGSIMGVVTTSLGPLQGAAVSVGELKTTTDASGRFALEKVPAGPMKLTVLSPDAQFESTSTDVAVVENDIKDLNLYLRESPGAISGVVTDERGNPLPKAKVWGALGSLEPTTVETDEKGRFVLAGAPAGEHYIRAKADGYMSEGASVRVMGSKAVECDFALKAGAISLGGVVLDTGGRPVEAELCLMCKGVVALRTKSSSSDGKYIFPHLIPGMYEITMVSPGYAPKGWDGRLDGDVEVNFALEKMGPPPNAYIDGH